MSGTYKIKGTLQVSCTVGEIRFSIFPDTAYLSPDKKSAVLYQDGADAVARKLELSENKISVSVSVSENLKSLLIQLALHNKHVELHLDESCETITGFTYPAR